MPPGGQSHEESAGEEGDDARRRIEEELDSGAHKIPIPRAPTRSDDCDVVGYGCRLVVRSCHFSICAGAETECCVHVNGHAETVTAAGFLFSSMNGRLLRHSNTYIRFFKPALTEAGR